MKLNTSKQAFKINQTINTILDKRPQLEKLAIDEPVLEYLRPAIEWRQQQEIFPYAVLLSKLITSNIKRLYGEDLANEAKTHLEQSWVIETGAHLNIPRQFDKAGVTEGPQLNSLLFQGQILWAMANKSLGRRLSISLNSGRVPPDNTNSGAYLDLPALKLPVTMVSKKKHPDSPQTLIPARNAQEIEEKIELLDMYSKQRMLPQEQYFLGQEVLRNFLNVQSSFSDQVATTHALMLNKILPIKQVTLDSEPIGKDFFLELLKDPTSLIHAIFNDISLREKFLDCLTDIRTGWPQGGMPFHFVKREDEGFRLINYQGDLSPETIIKGLEEKTLFLTGVMKFFTLMVEAGILPVGGWTQAGYCTDIKRQAIKFLRELKYDQRAEILECMPTHIAAVGPCWGIDQLDDNFQLIDPITMILNPTSVDLSGITRITGNQALLVAAPTLYEFLKDEEAISIDYNEFKNMLRFAVVRNLLREEILIVPTPKKIQRQSISFLN